MKAVLVISLLLALASANYSWTVETRQVNAASSGSGEEFANNLKRTWQKPA